METASFPILHLLSLAFICLQSQMREHRHAAFLVIQNMKTGNGHVTQYGFEFLLLYILFNLAKLQALSSS